MDENSGLGKESVFEFKHVPTLKRMTREGQRKSYTFKRPGAEVISYLGLASAFAAVLLFGAGVYLVLMRVWPLFGVLRRTE
jgi:hypothetical protein